MNVEERVKSFGSGILNKDTKFEREKHSPKFMQYNHVAPKIIEEQYYVRISGYLRCNNYECYWAVEKDKKKMAIANISSSSTHLLIIVSRCADF